MGTKKENLSDLESHKQRVIDINNKPKLKHLAYMLPTYEKLIAELEAELLIKGTKLN